MHQIVCRLGLRPIRPLWGAYSAPPDPLAVFRGLLLKGGNERVGERRRREEGGSSSFNLPQEEKRKVGAYAVVRL